MARRLADESALEVPLNFRLSAASILFNYYNWTTKGDSADPLIARVTPWLDDPQASPVSQVWWRVHLAFNHQIRGRYEKARRTMSEAETIARENGLRSLLFEIYYAEVTPGGRFQRRAGRGGRAREAAHGAQTRRGGWTSRISASRNRSCAAPEGRHLEAATAAGPRRSASARAAGLPTMQVPHFLVRHALSPRGCATTSKARGRCTTRR